MSHIFTSYSRRDSQYVEKIVEFLTKRNEIEPWIDWQKIPKGEEVQPEIYLGIEEADVFLFFASPDSIRSKWCIAEIEYAAKNNKRIIPIIILDIATDSLPPEISKRDWVFCRESKDNFHKSIEEIQTAILSNYSWMKFHRELQVKALRWTAQNDSSRLLRGKELSTAEEQLATPSQKDPLPTDLQKKYVSASRKHERRLRITFTLTGLMAVFIIAIASLIAMNQTELANVNANAVTAVSANKAVIAQGQVLLDFGKKDPNLVQQNLLLAIEAYDLVDDYPYSDRVVFEQNLRDSIGLLSGTPVIAHSEDHVFSPDAKWLFNISSDEAPSLLNLKDQSLDLVMLKEISDDSGYNTESPVVSPDGKWLAVGRNDGAVHLWNLQDHSSDPIIIKGYGMEITSLAFSHDSLWLGTGSSDQTVRVWNMQDVSREPIIFDGHGNWVINLAFSPDGKWLVSVDTTYNVYLWDMEDKLSKPVILKRQAIYNSKVLFTPDSQFLVMDGLNEVWLWDVDNISSDPTILSADGGSIRSFAISQSGVWLGTGGCGVISVGQDCAQGMVNLWDLNELSLAPIRLQVHKSGINTLVFSPDDLWLATGSDDPVVYLWNLNNLLSEDPIPLSGFEYPVSNLVFSSDGLWLLGSNNGLARLWNINKLTSQPTTLRGRNNGFVRSLTFVPDGQHLVAGGTDGMVRLWDFQSPASDPIEFEGYNKLSNLAVSLDGQWFATGVNNYKVNLWDLNNPSELPKTFSSNSFEEITKVAISPDNHWMVANNNIGSINLWELDDASNNAIVLTRADHEGRNSLNGLAFSPDGKWLVAVGGIAELWDVGDLPAGSTVLNVIGLGGLYVNTFDFSPDSHWLAAGGENIQLWELGNIKNTPIEIYGNETLVTDVAFNSNGQRLAAASDEGVVRVWDVSNPDIEPIVLSGGADIGLYNLVLFSPDDKWLAATSSDNTVTLWNLNFPSDAPVVLYGHNEKINALLFSPDSQWLATGSDDRTVRLWSLNSEYLRNMACHVVGRNFTSWEWSQFFSNEEYRKTCDQWEIEIVP